MSILKRNRTETPTIDQQIETRADERYAVGLAAAEANHTALQERLDTEFAEHAAGVTAQLEERLAAGSEAGVPPEVADQLREALQAQIEDTRQ